MSVSGASYENSEHVVPLCSGGSDMDILENSANPDGVTHNVTFHRGLHRLLSHKHSSVKEIN